MNSDRLQKVTVEIIICPRCEPAYRYGEHSEGYFNNNSNYGINHITPSYLDFNTVLELAVEVMNDKT